MEPDKTRNPSVAAAVRLRFVCVLRCHRVPFSCGVDVESVEEIWSKPLSVLVAVG